jgi:hypothetical protein
MRRRLVRVLNPSNSFPANFLRGNVAARLVAMGEAKYRQRGEAVWLISVTERTPGVEAGSLRMATLKELCRIPVANAGRLLGLG